MSLPTEERCVLQTPHIATDLVDAHFERRFLQHLGIAPKLFARVGRVSDGIGCQDPTSNEDGSISPSNSDTQMHMVHDFHDLAGESPGRLLGLIGDARPRTDS